MGSLIRERERPFGEQQRFGGQQRFEEPGSWRNRRRIEGRFTLLSVRFLTLAICALTLVAAETRSRTASGIESIQAGQLKSDVTTLASDKMAGRRSLGDGSKRAIQWISAEFAKAGLKPLAGDSFLQPVPVIEYRSDPVNTTLTLRHKGKEETFRAPDATADFPSDVKLRGRVVFAGFGITAPELNYDDYVLAGTGRESTLDARGKIVLVFDHEPQENDADSIFNGKGNTRYANPEAKMMIAREHGAVALLIAPDPNHPHARQRDRSTDQTPPPTIHAQAAPHLQQALADETAIPVFNISSVLAEELLGATGKKPADLQAWIDATLQPQSVALSDTEVELHVVDSLRRPATTYNILGMVPGSDPSLSAETIVFSAHYDHEGLTAEGQVFHGADDNASGTVGVLNLARAFARNPIKPRRTLVFVAFAAEERGLLGSTYYVEHPLRPLETTRIDINFDMIGRNEAPSAQTTGFIHIDPDTSNELNVIGTKYSGDARSVIERCNQSIGLTLSYKFDEDTALNILFRADQYPFLLHDVPAMWWFTGFHPDYHEPSDTADKLNYSKMTKILKLAFVAGFELADTPTPPRFDASGGGGGK